jgi:uncharacterized protein
MQTIASDDADIPVTIGVQESVDFYQQPIPAGIWENTVTIRSMRCSPATIRSPTF